MTAVVITQLRIILCENNYTLAPSSDLNLTDVGKDQTFPIKVDNIKYTIIYRENGDFVLSWS